MRRRAFIAVAAAAAAWPFAASAQPARRPVLGYLGPSSAAAQRAVFDVFLARLAEFGWIEGRTLTVIRRWGEGRTDRLDEFAAEFVRLPVDIIVTSGAAAVLAAKRATTTIPIVFTIASDPVGTGLVTSLARPGGNVTGQSYLGPDLAPKRIEILRQLLPELRRLGVVANGDSAGAALEGREARAAAAAVGLEAVLFDIRRAEDFHVAFARDDRVGALYFASDPLFNTNKLLLVKLALEARMPTIGDREFIDAGGLLSYGPTQKDLARRAAEQVNHILRGAKAGDLPVEEPVKFEFAINLTAAKALGLAVPQPLLLQADEIIE